MFAKFKQRSYELEHLDTGNYTPEEYEGCIAELQLVNRWLGDARVLKRTLFREIERDSLKEFSLLDVGAGSGELLRVAATWARSTGRRLKAVGLELNERSAQSIREESKEFDEITSVRGNALQLPFAAAEFDYVMCSLFTHHLTDEQVVQVLREMGRVARRRIFVIDLHRDPVPYFFYITLGKLLLKNRLVRHDGALSILRSFKAEELESLGQAAGLRDVLVEHHFPARLVLKAAGAPRSNTVGPPATAGGNGADHYDAIIAGAGPAGTSAAIHLARRGRRVLLIEQKKFPRAKLCGEFISPECQDHFEKLGVARAIICSGPALLNETVFYSPQGRHVTVPSDWLGGRTALGLSRAVMDHLLLSRAAETGVTVLENANVIEPQIEEGCVRGIRVRVGADERDYRAPVTIDATGRSRILARKISARNSKPRLVAFKAHLQKTLVSQNACEIYFYSGGYGGLSTIEGDESNLCFIVEAEYVKRCHSDPERVMREVVMNNPRARHTLAGAVVTSEWLSASWEHFGRYQPAPAPGLLAVGDAAAFIDPFTGSGMLMALESGELAAEVILRNRTMGGLAREYAAAYRKKFDSRLRICSLIRRAAFRPRLAEWGVTIFSASEGFRNRVARATRSERRVDRNC